MTAKRILAAALVYSTVCICLFARAATANVEKIIFTGPRPSDSDDVLSSLDILRLSPDDELSARADLRRVFVPEKSPSRGLSSWILITNLTENQKYELRICWSALVRKNRVFR